MICLIDDCKKRGKRRGLCDEHYFVLGKKSERKLNKQEKYYIESMVRAVQMYRRLIEAETDHNKQQELINRLISVLLTLNPLREAKKNENAMESV